MTPRRIAAAILIAGFGAMLAWNAPGQLSYDSVAQLADGRSGFYNSWHPPVMAWLLGLFDAVLPGTLLFLIFQSGLLLLALLGLLWLKPPRGGSGWACATVALLIVLTPQWLLYLGEIWKDMLFAAAAIAGFAALALAAQHWRGRGPWLVLAALLLTLAACTRQNGLVLLPVAAVALGLIARRQDKTSAKGWLYGGGFLAATLALGAAGTLALAAHGDGGAGAAAEIRLAQGYDLAGALARQPTLALPRLAARDPKLEALLRNRGAALYSAQRNDPFGADPKIADALSDAPGGAISGQWRDLVLRHPALYLRTRLAVFAQVFLTPDLLACHPAYVGTDGDPRLLRALGLKAQVRPQDQGLQSYAQLFFATPVFSHLMWAALALVLMIVLLRRGSPADLAVAALLAGALLFTVTFVMISIACDYRYLVFVDLSAMAAALYATARR